MSKQINIPVENNKKSQTRFYRHYKNKPYKLIGTVRHSETLEELALYESLYDNKLGKLWVRPKEMFFEDINLDGKVLPRFEKIHFTYLVQHEVSTNLIEKIGEVFALSFKTKLIPEQFISKFNSYKKALVILAFDGEKMLGFKIGFKTDHSTFYSWMGAVLPEYQKLGVGSELMLLQHEWCANNGLQKIETRTQNEYTDMIKLNLKFGFVITGTLSEKDKPLKILLEKLIY